MKTNKNKQSGFTLMEVIVVIGIMGVLMAIAIPSESSYRQKAEIKTSTKDLRSLFWEAQSRSLAPRTADVTSYKIDLVKGQLGGTMPITIKECSPDPANISQDICQPITGSEEPKVILGDNISLEDIQLDGVSIANVQTFFLVGDNKNSGQIGFSQGATNLDKNQMRVTLGSSLVPTLKYDIVVDRQTNSITYNAK